MLTDDSIIDEPENLPKYSDCCKFFIVEELALQKDYRELHFGKCSVIGRVRESINGGFQLENIPLPNIIRQYSLPEGTLSIPLLWINSTGEGLANRCFVEVIGEVVLYNKENPKANHTPITSRGVHEHLASLSTVDEQDKYLSDLQRTHVPAIKVMHLNEIDRASDLAERNLEIRLLIQ